MGETLSDLVVAVRARDVNLDGAVDEDGTDLQPELEAAL